MRGRATTKAAEIAARRAAHRKPPPAAMITGGMAITPYACGQSSRID
jgi:hypothetical protein